MSKELKTAVAAAKAGGDIVAHYFQKGVEIRGKESYNLVSDADVESEHAIVDVIRSHFPDHSILGEESYKDDVSAADLWVVDPLDGTNNFAHHVPHFAISIAYVREGKTQCGVIYNPIRNDWYTAELGAGAFHNDRPVRTGTETALNEVLVGVGFYYDRGAMMEATLAAIADLFREHIHGIRRFGTASLDLCQVGVGMYGSYFEYELSPWDFAAGALFVAEAGGKVSTCEGDPLPLARTSLLASNGPLHEPTLRIVQKHYQGLAKKT